MSSEAWLTAAVILAMLAGMALRKLSPAVLVFFATVLLLFLGVVEPSEAFSGFSNPAPFTVAALLVLARAISKTGAIRPLSQGLLGDRGHIRRPMTKLLGSVSVASAFMNNTPLVAMMIPEVLTWARKRRLDASRFLLPLSFATILGGTATLIGTSTNLVVAGLAQEQGLSDLGFFEFGRVGVPLTLVGLVVIIALAPKVLARRRSTPSAIEEPDRAFYLDFEVIPAGPLDGRTVDQAGLRHLAGVFLVSVDRGDSLIAPAAPETVLAGRDILRFVGRFDQVLDLQDTNGLRHAEHRHLNEITSRSARYFAVAIGLDSPLVGQNLREARFRSRYSAAVVAIHRAGERIDAKLGDVVLRVGDALVVLSDPGFADRWNNRSDFLLISDLSETAQPVVLGRIRTLLVLIAMVAVSATGLVPILHASLAAAGLVILIGVLTPAEARRALDIQVLVVIASAFGIAAAVTSSGLGEAVATVLVDYFGELGDRGILLGIVLATVVMTELITNNAAALLMFPVALAAAPAAGLQAEGMAVAVAIAASASFLTPLGYQTNTMVYSQGGYRMADYLRLGAPLTVVAIAAVVGLVPLFYGV